MKALLLALLLSLASATAQPPAPTPQHNRDLRQLLQDGLFEEEANRNLEKAAAAYESLLEGFEQQRKYAATSLFRLAEVRAKQNRKDDALALYQRVVTEFGSDPLAKLSRERIAALGGTAPTPGTLALADREAEEIARLQDLVKNSPDLLNAEKDDLTPLAKAAKEGWINAASFLIDHGADLGNRFGRPALHIAAANGRKAMVELLIKRGADVNGPDAAGGTALVSAITSSRPEVAKVLLELGADPNKKDTFERNPLHHACLKGDIEMVKLLLPKVADLNVVCRGNRTEEAAGTPLFTAIRFRHMPIAKLLLERGADPNASASDVTNPLRLAIEALDYETAELLLINRANPNVPRLLHRTIEADQIRFCQLLIKHKADVNAKAPESAGANAPLHLAATRSADFTKILLDAGASPDVTDAQQQTPLLMVSGMFGNSSQNSQPPPVIPLGVNRGRVRPIPSPVTQNRPSTESYDPFKIMKLLVAKGANVNTKGYGGLTPFASLISQPDAPLEVLQWLLDQGADPEITTAEGQKPITLAPSMERRIWLERRLVFPQWTKVQQISAIFRCVGSGAMSEEPVRITPAAEFDAAPSAIEVLQTLARSIQKKVGPPNQQIVVSSRLGGKMVPMDFNLRVFRGAKGGVEEVANVAVKLSNNELHGNLPALKWGDVFVVQSDVNGGSFDYPDSIHALRPTHAPTPLKVSVQVGERKAELALSGTRPFWSPVTGSLPAWNLSELVTHLVGAEPRADLGAIKLQRKMPDGASKEWTVDLRSTTAGEAIKQLPARFADGDAITIPMLPADVPAAIASRKAGIFRAAPGRVFGERVFALSSSDDAPRTLGELLAESYATSKMVIPAPDLSKIKIHRLTPSNEEETIEVDMAARVDEVAGKSSNEEARKLDYSLQPGDVVEIPVLKNSAPEKWTGFSGETRLFLGKALARDIAVALNNAPDKVWALLPAFRRFTGQVTQDGAIWWDANQAKSNPFRVMTVVTQELPNLLRVRIISRGKPQELTAEAARTINPWLIAGDRMEIECY